MGMLLHRHYIESLEHSEAKGVAKEVAPKTSADKESVAPTKTEKVDSKPMSYSVNYTKTEINRTATSELKNIARSIGISDADSYTGAELKKMIISKLGL